MQESVEQLLLKLNELKIGVKLQDDELKLSIPKGTDASSVIPEVRALKQDLINYISERQQNSQPSLEGLVVVPAQAAYALSGAQKRMFFLDQFEPDSISYNISQVLKFTGAIDVNRLKNSFRMLVGRHEILRSYYVLEADGVVQKVDDAPEFDVEEIEKGDQDIETLVRNFIRPFDLSSAPLIRAGLVKLRTDESLLLIDMHHIVSDGVSSNILVQDFFGYYQGLEPAPLSFQYKDYAEWQQTPVYAKRIERQRNFWLEQFADPIDPLVLPYDFPRPAVKSFEGNTLTFRFDERLSKQINELASRERCTPFMTVLSIFKVMLYKLSGQDELVVGTPVAGRTHEDLQEIVGMFVNTIAIKNTIDSSQTFQEFLASLKQNTLSCFNNQGYQYETLVEDLQLERSTSRNSLFDVMFSFNNFELSDVSLSDIRIEPVSFDTKISKFDLTLTGFEAEGQFTFSLEYAADLFTKQTVQTFITYFEKIALMVTTTPEVKLAAIGLLSAKEEKELLALGAGNPLPVSEHENIISQFRDMVAKYGDHEAISWDGKAITYAALDERSEQLAAHLVAHGLTSRQVAGVMMERSPDVVIAILAILKAGAAYLPIDPQLPESRIKTMLDSTQSGMVVINESTPAVSYLDAQLIDMSAAETWTSQGDCKDIAIAPEDLCYILYTSGSTGAPKGAQIRHGSVVNLIRSLATRYEMDPTDDKILLFSNIVFDASVMQMWLALLHGNTLVIPPYETLLEENAFNSMLEDRGVTHLFMTPSFLENIDFQANTALKRIEIGGEALKPTLLAKIPREVLLYNCYGPTEATVMASNGLVDRGEDEASKISLGAPLHHINLLILDQDRQMVPMGVPGELYIGGRGVGNGYINDPELTSKSFVPNPYAAGETIYRTGDIVCREKDGTISFVGRKDDQVKFRGYRLELGDIENSLRAMDFIKEALVILRTDFGQDYLAAYLIPDDSSVALDESLIARIKAHIASQLPPYMVPQHFTMMESFPLTLSGKLDKRKLPIPSQEADSDRYATATTETELQVRKIWSQVLNLPEEKISIDANFFTLGGHSLKAAFLVNSINEAFELDLSVKDFFARQDVKSFSAYIDRLDRSGAVSIPQAPEATDYPLSSAQRRLYFLHAFDGESMAYNMPQAFTLSGKVDLQKVEDALSRLVDRHESLRTAIRVVNGEPRQFIEEQPGFEIEVFESEAAALSGFVRPFDITSAPLFRAGFAWKNGGEALLQLDFHHIITDGVSQDLLIGEFITLYNGSELPPLPIQFKDYAVWQQGAVYEERIANQKQFWLEKYATVPEALQLPYDFARPEFPDYKGSFIKLVIDPKQVASLKEIAQSQQTTMYAVTLALYYLLMSRLSNSEDITVGTPVSGRELKDVEQMNGMFVNTLPLRTQVDYGQTFADFVKQTGQDVFACLDNQAYPFEELLEELKIERDASRNPLFDTMFSYQRVEEYSAKLDSLEVRQASAMPAVEQFDLSMIAGEDVDGMVITLQYATALFTQETINRFGKYFLQIVQSAVSNPNSKLVDIRMLPEEEESALLAQLTGPVLSIPKHQTMVGLFEDSVKANSNGIALVFHEEELTYKALDDKVNQVANYLMAEGAKPGDVIGLSLERGIYQLVSMLAILKAGAAYLPIHRQYPDNRVQFMFEENNVSIVLTDESDVKEAFRDLHIINPIADIDFSRISSARPDVTIHPKSLAYILYTSGSTGKPKGVRVIHKGVVNMACALTKRYEFKHDERVLQFSTIAFDASVEQIWLAYSSANTLVLIDELTIGDNEGFSRYISQQQVTHIDATPSFLETLQIPDNSNLKRIVAGGEVFTNALAEALNGKATLYNSYGPTETTVTTTIYQVTEGDLGKRSSIPIGKPISNTRALVLGQHGQLQPVGVAGRLYIAGEGVSLGYVNRQALTDERFIDSPLLAGEKAYDTGDVVKLLPDGELTYLSRSDQQVKLRGFRIELGEVESAINRVDGVSNAVVTLYKKHGDGALVAYYVGREKLTVEQFKERLDSLLPNYMIPSMFMKVDEIPLNSNGKADVKALPTPYFEEGEIVAAETATEKALVTIWAEVLMLKPGAISTVRSFFDMGGHSLKAAFLVNNVNDAFNVEVSLKAFYLRPTIQHLASHIDQLDKTSFKGIPVAEEELHYPLTAAQRRLYFMYELDNSSLAYNVTQTFKLKGKIELQRLKEALAALVTRHESLRTTIAVIDGEPRQVVHENLPFQFDIYEDAEECLNEFVRSFDISTGPLFRAGFAWKNGEEALLQLDMHHIITDGVSQDILISEFITLYNGGQLPALRLQFKDYAVWQESEAYRDTVKLQKEFWLEKYETIPELLDLPYDHVRPTVPDYKGSFHHFLLDKHELDSLREIARKQNTTMYSVTLSLYYLLLSGLSGKQDLSVGTVVSGRSLKDVEQMNGMFVNTLPLRQQVDHQQTFADFVHQTGLEVLSYLENQSYPFEELLEELHIERDISRNPLFDTMFSYQKSETYEANLTDLEVIQAAGQQRAAQFDLSVEIGENADELAITFHYATALFDPETIAHFGRYMKQLIRSVVERPDIPLSEIRMLTPEEENSILSKLAGPVVEVPREKNLVDLFEASVAETPNHVAIVFHDQEISYLELDKRANQLANHLIANELAPGEVVGLLLERGISQFVSILAVLKAGAAYMPIHKDYPTTRRQLMCEENKVKLIISDSSDLQEELPQQTIINPLVDMDGQTAYDSAPVVTMSPDAIAYIIYTSGSTGKPKGVQALHRNVVNLAHAQRQRYNLQPQERILQFSTIAFDASVEQTWLALLFSNTLVLVDELTITDSQALSRYIIDQEITHFNATPSYLEQVHFPDQHQLRRIVMGGEACSVQLAKRLITEASLYNSYGPTETTVTSVVHQVTESDVTSGSSIPIGRPIGNTNLLILGTNGEILPYGVPGKLFIAGDGVTRGYVDRPALNDERFISSPLLKGAKTYDSGDVVKLMADGRLIYVSRSDQQVKLRGFRIELGEIEHAIAQVKGVSRSVVVLHKEDHGDALVAYYVGEQKLSIEELREQLTALIPAYMIPSMLIKIDQIPLNSNGKVDFRALPAPYYDEGEVTLPATATEEAVVVIWAEVLKLSTEVISTTRSFFDLGGHSLKAAYLVNRVNEAFQVEVSLRDFFLFPDVKNLSAFIDSLEYTEVYSLSKAAIQPHYPLTSAQKRLYFIHTMDSYSLAYNVTQAFVLKGQIDQQKLKYTFTRLVERHESLMTSIKLVDGEPRQFIQQQPDFSFEVYDDAEACMTQFVRPFDLSQGPLFRVGFAMKGEGEALLHLDMHHIITDGISQNVLISEFIRLYNGDQLAEPELQFKDYAVWQQSNDYQKRVERQKRFWLEKYDSLPDALQLPYDHTRPEVPDYQGAYHHFVIEQEQVMRLREIAVKEQTTLYAVTLSLYYLLLARLGNQEDVVVGTPVGGRELKDIEQMNGMFVNTLPLRQQIDYQMSFSDLVAKTGADVFFSMANQAYPFEELLEELKIARDIGRNPLFDTMFSYRNTEDAIPKLDNLEVIPVSSDQNLAQFDLSVDVGEEPAGLVVTMEYATSVFEQATIERFAGYFQQIVNAVVENADVRLSAIDLLTAQEKSTLLRQLSGKKFPIPQGENLVSLFETSVDGNPDGVALVYHETQLTYQQFDEKANQIANYLIEGGVKPGDSVGLFQERGIDQLASMLAILKAGAAYLPIHKQYPESRRQLMLEENQVKILLTDEGDLGHKLSDLKVINPIKEIDFSKADTNRPGIHIPTDSLSYILYTSGSTGKPKGVQVMHKGVVNMVMALREFYELQDQERLLQFSTIAFDASVEQIWLAFSTGNTLVLIDELTIGDSKEFVHYITRHQLTHIDATPTFLDQLHIPDENRLRRIVAGGEVLTLALAERLSHKAQVYNAYGPTETTVTATVHKVSHADIDKGKGVPIGQPIGNTSALVLGKHGQVQPYGVPGRLYIAGAGVSKGYVNRPALTNERFITHHLVAEGKVYDTGDIATLQPDGRLMYQSRSDQQVKLRGFRIELGEIESAMISLDKVTSAVVTLYEKNGDSALVAWYVSTARISSEQLKERLQDHLPSFMIPSILMKVDKIPLNSSGKAAISALPSPYFERGEVTLAETETEMTLVELWSQVLKIDADDISTTRSFFDLGGHSLKVAQLKHEITNSLGYEVSVVQLFQYQTIREQAKLVGQNDRSDAQNNDQHLILALNEIKEGAPALFFIHDGSGDVLGYKKLATVMQEYNCWGIRSATLSYAGPVEMTVQQLAKRYIELIRGVQPAGALSVVGWSLGGSIAYEIARQLESSGDQLNHLVMIDTDFFCETFRETGSSQHFGFAEELKLVSNIGMSLSKDQIAEITDAEMLWSRLIDKLRGSQTLFAQFKKYLPEDVKALIPFWNEHKADELVRLCNTIRSLTYAVSTYQSTGKVSAPAAYLSASQTDLNLSDLDEHFGQQVTIMTIQASHFNILKQPQLHQTVKVMRNYLTQPKTTVLQDNMNK